MKTSFRQMGTCRNLAVDVSFASNIVNKRKQGEFQFILPDLYFKMDQEAEEQHENEAVQALLQLINMNYQNNYISNLHMKTIINHIEYHLSMLTHDVLLQSLYLQIKQKLIQNNAHFQEDEYNNIKNQLLKLQKEEKIGVTYAHSNIHAKGSSESAKEDAIQTLMVPIIREPSDVFQKFHLSVMTRINLRKDYRWKKSVNEFYKMFQNLDEESQYVFLDTMNMSLSEIWSIKEMSSEEWKVFAKNVSRNIDVFTQKLINIENEKIENANNQMIQSEHHTINQNEFMGDTEHSSQYDTINENETINSEIVKQNLLSFIENGSKEDTVYFVQNLLQNQQTESMLTEWFREDSKEIIYHLQHDEIIESKEKYQMFEEKLTTWIERLTESEWKELEQSFLNNAQYRVESTSRYEHIQDEVLQKQKLLETVLQISKSLIQDTQEHYYDTQENQEYYSQQHTLEEQIEYEHLESQIEMREQIVRLEKQVQGTFAQMLDSQFLLHYDEAYEEMIHQNTYMTEKIFKEENLLEEKKLMLKEFLVSQQVEKRAGIIEEILTNQVLNENFLESQQLTKEEIKEALDMRNDMITWSQINNYYESIDQWNHRIQREDLLQLIEHESMHEICRLVQSAIIEIEEFTMTEVEKRNEHRLEWSQNGELVFETLQEGIVKWISLLNRNELSMLCNEMTQYISSHLENKNEQTFMESAEWLSILRNEGHVEFRQKEFLEMLESKQTSNIASHIMEFLESSETEKIFQNWFEEEQERLAELVHVENISKENINQNIDSNIKHENIKHENIEHENIVEKIEQISDIIEEKFKFWVACANQEEWLSFEQAFVNHENYRMNQVRKNVVESEEYLRGQALLELVNVQFHDEDLEYSSRHSLIKAETRIELKREALLNILDSDEKTRMISRFLDILEEKESAEFLEIQREFVTRLDEKELTNLIHTHNVDNHLITSELSEKIEEVLRSWIEQSRWEDLQLFEKENTLFELMKVEEMRLSNIQLQEDELEHSSQHRIIKSKSRMELKREAFLNILDSNEKTRMISRFLNILEEKESSELNEIQQEFVVRLDEKELVNLIHTHNADNHLITTELSEKVEEVLRSWIGKSRWEDLQLFEKESTLLELLKVEEMRLSNQRMQEIENNIESWIRELQEIHRVQEMTGEVIKNSQIAEIEKKIRNNIEAEMDTQTIIERDASTQTIIERDVNTQTIMERDANIQTIMERDASTQTIMERDASTQTIMERDVNTQTIIERDANIQAIEEQEMKLRQIVEQKMQEEITDERRYTQEENRQEINTIKNVLQEIELQGMSKQEYEHHQFFAEEVELLHFLEKNKEESIVAVLEKLINHPTMSQLLEKRLHYTKNDIQELVESSQEYIELLEQNQSYTESILNEAISATSVKEEVTLDKKKELLTVLETSPQEYIVALMNKVMEQTNNFTTTNKFTTVQENRYEGALVEFREWIVNLDDVQWGTFEESVLQNIQNRVVHMLQQSKVEEVSTKLDEYSETILQILQPNDESMQYETNTKKIQLLQVLHSKKEYMIPVIEEILKNQVVSNTLEQWIEYDLESVQQLLEQSLSDYTVFETTQYHEITESMIEWMSYLSEDEWQQVEHLILSSTNHHITNQESRTESYNLNMTDINTGINKFYYEYAEPMLKALEYRPELMLEGWQKVVEQIQQNWNTQAFSQIYNIHNTIKNTSNNINSNTSNNINSNTSNNINSNTSNSANNNLNYNTNNNINSNINNDIHSSINDSISNNTYHNVDSRIEKIQAIFGEAQLQHLVETHTQLVKQKSEEQKRTEKYVEERNVLQQERILQLHSTNLTENLTENIKTILQTTESLPSQLLLKIQNDGMNKSSKNNYEMTTLNYNQREMEDLSSDTTYMPVSLFVANPKENQVTPIVQNTIDTTRKELLTEITNVKNYVKDSKVEHHTQVESVELANLSKKIQEHEIQLKTIKEEQVGTLKTSDMPRIAKNLEKNLQSNLRIEKMRKGGF